MRLFCAVLGFLFCQHAMAGFMAEPNLSVSTGAFTGEANSGTSVKPINYNAFGAGLRVGYDWGSFWMALDASYAAGSGSDDSDSYTMTDTNAGLSLGYDMTKYRFYAGYIPMANFTQKSDVLETNFAGSGFKFGVSAFMTAKWVLNIEIVSKTFSKMTINGTELDTSVGFKSLRYVPLTVSIGYLF